VESNYLLYLLCWLKINKLNTALVSAQPPVQRMLESFPRNWWSYICSRNSSYETILSSEVFEFSTDFEVWFLKYPFKYSHNYIYLSRTVFATEILCVFRKLTYMLRIYIYLFRIVTNRCTIISQINTLLRVSTMCHLLFWCSCFVCYFRWFCCWRIMVSVAWFCIFCENGFVFSNFSLVFCSSWFLSVGRLLF
jgi:hypothetical protein